MNEQPRRRILEFGVIGVVSLISAGLAAVLAAAVTAPARKSPSRQMADVGALDQLTETPQKFEIIREQTQGWWSQRQSSIVYAYRQRSGEVTAFSSTCTHLGCTIRWEEEAGRFECPCHGGSFAVDGTVRTGPPSRELTRLPVEIQNGRFHIELA